MKKAYVVYHVDTTMEVASYARERQAFTRCKKMNDNVRINRVRNMRYAAQPDNEYAVANRAYYEKYVVYMVRSI